MKTRLRIPIRLKILVSLLILVTAVVSVITFSMANLFHGDKMGYITGLLSIIAQNKAEEAHSLFEGYQSRIRSYSRIIDDEALKGPEKERLLQGLIEDFPALIALITSEGDEETSAVFNTSILGMTQIDRDDIRREADEQEALTDADVSIRCASFSSSLPSFSMSFTLEGEDGVRRDIFALLHLEELQRIASRSQGVEVSVVDSTGRLLADRSAGIQKIGRPAGLPAEIANLRSSRTSQRTLEYVHNDVDTIGGFAAVEIGEVIVSSRLPKSAAFIASRRLFEQMRWVTPALLILATLIGMIWARRITRPVEQLSNASEQIAKGQFDVEVDLKSRDEMGDLAQSFNRMASELHDREEALEEAQAQLVQSEKMAAFGQLGAGIAHEVKNPLAGILGCAQFSLRKAPKEGPVYENLMLIAKETRRCKTIIENLLRFARQEKAALLPTSVNEIVQDSVAIVHHQLDIHKVKLDLDLGEELPQIHGNGNQLQQVLMNLMINAQQAMEGEAGSIQIGTRLADEDHLEIVVSDTGPGMEPEVKEKLFEPFFTTKPGGKGTGLGLSVSFGIIRDHQGEILVESEPGDGSTFVIRLPVPHADSPVPEPIAAEVC